MSLGTTVSPNLYFTKHYARRTTKDRDTAHTQGGTRESLSAIPLSPSIAIAAIYCEARRNLCTACARSPRARMKIPVDCNQASLPTSVLDTESTRHRRSKGFARTLDSSGLRKRSVSTLRNLFFREVSL